MVMGKINKNEFSNYFIIILLMNHTKSKVVLMPASDFKPSYLEYFSKYINGVLLVDSDHWAMVYMGKGMINIYDVRDDIQYSINYDDVELFNMIKYEVYDDADKGRYKYKISKRTDTEFIIHYIKDNKESTFVVPKV